MSLFFKDHASRLEFTTAVVLKDNACYTEQVWRQIQINKN